MRVRALLLLGYAAVITILLVSGAVTTSDARRKMKETIDQDAATLAAALIDEIEIAIGERVDALHAFAGLSSDLQRVVAESNRAYDALGSKSAIDAAIDAAENAWVEPPGRPTPAMEEIARSEASAILRRAMSFHERRRGLPVFGEIIVANRHGATVGFTGYTTDFRQDDEDWWQFAAREGSWIADVVEIDKSSQVDSLEIGVRVEDDEGRPIGAMKASMDVSVVRNIIEEFGRRSRLRGAGIELLDSNARLIHRLGDDAKTRGEDLSHQTAARMLLEGRSGSVVEMTDRGETLRAFVGPRDAARGTSPRWSLILNRRTDDAYEPLRTMTRNSIAIGLVGASLAVLVGGLLAAAFGRMTQNLKDASDALRVSEAHVRSIVKSAVDGIVTADATGRIETFNPAAEHMFGRAAADVQGKNVRLLMPEPFASAHDGYLRRLQETGVPRVLGMQLELHGVRADGTEFPLDLALGEIEDGGRHRFVAILRDATERHDARRALEAAKNAAESASRSKSQFLANMSHELRTPLNAIIGYSEMVAEELQERSEDALAADVGRIRTAGLRLLGLIDQILDLSKIEAGRVDAFREAFDLNEALAEVVATVAPLVRTNANRLVVDVPDGLGTVYSDVAKLRQILLNLLSNAAKFTESGTIRLAGRREAGAQHDWIVLSVGDDGIGMTPEQLSTVWDAFAQADASTTRRYGGTGLGLTITRKFAEVLGGTVDVASEPGRGTQFTVRLPAPQPPQADDGLQRDGGAAVHERASRQVVVVDDDAATRDLVRRILSAEGFDVHEAADGAEGLRLVRELRPAAVVLDVLMPDIDGWGVLAALRADPDTADTPVVMLTIEERPEPGAMPGVDAYLTKPIERVALQRALAPYRAA